MSAKTSEPLLLVLIAIAWSLGACVRAPIPTSDQPTATITRSPTPTTSFTPLPSATTTATRPPTVTPPPTITPRPTGLRTTIEYERNPRALLIEADINRNSTPRGSHVPLFRLYADGFVVFAGDWTPLSTGLDALARVGRLSESDVQTLLGDIDQLGFFALDSLYQAKAISTDVPVARISVYLDKAKVVTVTDSDASVTPPSFSDAFARILAALPADARTFTPTDGYLLAQTAGPASDFRNKDVTDWSIASIRLADVTAGMTVSGNLYAQVVALIARTSAAAFYREGDRVYRVSFSPNLPRAVHITAWLGNILAAPREFEGRVFDIIGYFRGWNLLGEAAGSPPVTRSDWVIADDGGAMYVNGALPEGLNGGVRADAWTLVRLRAAVVYVRLGTSHLQVRSVQVLARDLPGVMSTLTATGTTTPRITPVLGATAAQTVTSTPMLTPPATTAAK